MFFNLNLTIYFIYFIVEPVIKHHGK